LLLKEGCEKRRNRQFLQHPIALSLAADYYGLFAMKKRILFLSDIDSAHTRKWAVSLSDRGYAIGIFSLARSNSNWYKNYPLITVFDREGFQKKKFYSGAWSKLSYLRLLPALRNSIAEFKPDIVHAHYATSYGLLGVRSKFHPLIISVWGADIFDFPQVSFLHKMLVKNNLRHADRIFSTSYVMKEEILKYVKADIAVTPFGVDTKIFCRKEVVPLFDAGTKVVGIIKTLESKYGIDILLRAFALVKNEFSDAPLKLLIAGSGTKENEYQKLSGELGITDATFFSGHLPHEKVAAYHNHIDVFVSPSILDSESFGVSVVEAMACERPVVVSSVAGLKEVVEDNVTGMVVPPKDERKTADAILSFLRNPEKAAQFGKAGRARVLKYYDWEKNLDAIEALYEKIK
jgi:glycosyltransferase involved in cell wall biosynthesis